MSHGLSGSLACTAALQPPTWRFAREEAPPLSLTPREAESAPVPADGELDLPVAELVRRASSGDAVAWAALVKAYSGRVFGLLQRQCGDRDLAEELTQATFVKLVHKLGDHESGGAGYDERGRFESWLFRVATNGLRDELRRRKRQARPTDMSPAATSGRHDEAQSWAGLQGEGILRGPSRPEDPATLVERAEQVERLRAAVARLPEADREVLYLRHTAGMSFADIAASIGAPLGTVLARAHRALGKLRKLMPELTDEA